MFDEGRATRMIRTDNKKIKRLDQKSVCPYSIFHALYRMAIIIQSDVFKLFALEWTFHATVLHYNIELTSCTGPFPYVMLGCGELVIIGSCVI